MGPPGPAARVRTAPGSPATPSTQKAQAQRSGSLTQSSSSPTGGSGPSSIPGSPKRQDTATRFNGVSDSRASTSMSRVSSAGDVVVKKVGDQEDRLGSPGDDKFADGEGRGLFHVIEQLAALEGALWSVLDGLKSNATHCSFFCREYWGTSASHAQLSLERLACNERLKRQVQQACVLESLSLGVASHLCSGVMQGVSVTVRSRLRNLLYYIHENCLVLLDLVCQRWLAENPARAGDGEPRSGHCPENLNLDILVRVKRYRRLRRGEHIMALRQHNEMIANVVRQLCRGGTTKQRPPLTSRGGISSPGDRSPGMGGGAPTVLSAVNEVLSSRMPLDRLRASAIRSKMLQHMRFRALLNLEADPDCPWPQEDPYDRYGSEHFAQDAPTIWFEPLPPMLPNLEHNPKLPTTVPADVYTLVLDLDETLVHYFELDGMGSYEIRPGMHDFLQRMHALGFEIVIFTAATQDYADWVIDQVDPDHYVHHRLYRQHALPWGPIFVKDLSRIGRDLDRTLIIDNVQENFMLQPHNGIFICPWYDDPHDTALTALTPLLDELTKTRVKVHDLLDKYREQIPTWAGFDQFSQLAGEFSELEENVDHGCPPEPPPQNVQHHQPIAPRQVASPVPEPAPQRYIQEQPSTSARQEQPSSVRGAEVSPPGSPSVPSPPQPQPPLPAQQQQQQQQLAAKGPTPLQSSPQADAQRYVQPQQQPSPQPAATQPLQPQPQSPQQHHHAVQYAQAQRPTITTTTTTTTHGSQTLIARPTQPGDHAVTMGATISPAGSHVPPVQNGTATPVYPGWDGSTRYVLQRGSFPAQLQASTLQGSPLQTSQLHSPQLQATRTTVPTARPPPQTAVPQQAASASPCQQSARTTELRPANPAMPMRPAFSGVAGPYQAAPPPSVAPAAQAASWARAGVGPHQLQRRR